MAYTPNKDIIIGTVNESPKVENFLRPNGFRFVINEMPKVAYTCQKANIPNILMGFSQQPNPFIDINRVGDKLTFGDLNIQFLIAEDMSNYLELYDWLIAIGFPDDYNQIPRFSGERMTRFPFIRSKSNEFEPTLYSDATLTVLNSNNIAKTLIRFNDLFPVSLEGLDFDVTSTSVDYFVGSATFKYRTFEVVTL